MLGAAHSVPGTDALVALVRDEYDLAGPVSCTYLSRGLNDTFLIRSGGADRTRAARRRRTEGESSRSILRVYRSGWRTAGNIRYEHALLTHLQERLPPDVAVSTPILRRDGASYRAIKAPEGTRHVALFTYAPGSPPAWEGLDRCVAYGGAVASLHNASDDFDCRHPRFDVDLEHLVAAPIRSLRPRLMHRAADFDYVQRVAARLRTRMEELGDDLTWGAGHADLQAKNAHLSPGAPARGKSTNGGTFTFFDFDCGGPTWRAFDLSWCRMEASQAKAPGLWGAFLRGYRERRPLSRADHLAVPWFVLSIHIWWMGLIADLGREWGTSWFDHFVTQQVGALRRWESKHVTRR